MNYREAQRLAVVQDDSPQSKDLAQQAIGPSTRRRSSCRCRPSSRAGRTIETIAKAAVASKPNFVLWTGAAAPGGELVKALRDAGYKGTFTATAASEDPEFLAAAGRGGRGRVRDGDRDAAQHADGRAVARALQGALPARAAASRPSRAMTRCGCSRTRSRRPRAPTARSDQGDDDARPEVRELARRRALRGRSPLLYDNRVILKVKTEPSRGSGRCVPTRWGDAAVALLAALALAVGAPAARADGDPASDVLISGARLLARTRSSCRSRSTEGAGGRPCAGDRAGLRDPRRADQRRVRPRLGRPAVAQAAGLREVPRPGAGELQHATGCWS